MYRHSDRTQTSPTLIEYRSRRFRPGFVLLGLLFVAIGLLFVGTQRATRITCERFSELTSGSCTVRRYALVGSFDVDVPLDEIETLDVRVVRGSKGSKHAEVRLRMGAPSRDTLTIETSSWVGISPESAFAARSGLAAYKLDPKMPRFDAWLTKSVGLWVTMVLFALALSAIGVAMLREQLGQLRPVRVVVDHARGVVIARKREIPVGEVEDVTVELGRALFWSSGKNEHVPGYRLVLRRRAGEDIPVTKEFRAGNAGAHEGARKALLRALGRTPD